MIYTERIRLRTETGKFYDITDEVQKIVRKSEIENGICQIFCPGSTGAIILNENDSALLEDINQALERVAELNRLYMHPDNAWSHIHATFLGSEKTIPVKNGKLVLGTWQSVMFRECDNKSRSREIVINVIGE